MFFNFSFASDSTAHSIPVGYNSIITFAKISDVIVDEFYIANDSDLILPDENGEQYTEETYTIPNDTYWDNNTLLHANFNGNPNAGNLRFNKNDIQAIKLKKRIYGDLEWQTIFSRNVDTHKDDNPFNLSYMDYLEPGDTDIEYTYSVVINNLDHDSVLAREEYIDEDGNKKFRSRIHSEFNNYFIIGTDIVTEGNEDKIHNTVYQAIANPSTIPKYNRASGTIVSPGSKYPFIINNGISRYYSGTFSAIFFYIEDCCTLNDKQLYKLRNQIDKFLTNGKAKLLKKFDGDMWLINVVGDINRNDEGNWNHMSQSFDWIETGDPFNFDDLRSNNFILLGR